MRNFIICIILLFLLMSTLIGQPIDAKNLKSFLVDSGFIENQGDSLFFDIPELLYEKIMGKIAPSAQVYAEKVEDITYNYFIYDKTDGKQLVFFIFAWFEVDGNIYQFYKYNKDLNSYNTKKWIDFDRDNEEQDYEVLYFWF